MSRRWSRGMSVLTLLWWLVVPAVAADNPAFDQANRLYEQGKYREAAESYQTLLANGTVSAAVWFNLGNAQFKAGHVGDAVAAYLQAEKLAPRESDIRANLEFARKQVSGPTLKSGWLHARMESLSTNEWTLLAMLLVWGWFGLMLAGQLKPAWKPGLRRWLWLTGGGGAVACGALLFVVEHRLNERMLVVNSRDSVVRAGPFEESPSTFTAADGAEFTLLDAKGEWYQISDGNKPLGWVKTNAVVMIR